MKRFSCEKCSGVLPKRNIECVKCGYVNERLYPRVERARKRKKIIVIIAVISIIIAFFVSCNAFMLYPWQYQARHNRKAILEYARENYPGAKVADEYYQTIKFNPTNKPFDIIWFELDGIKFYIEARDGKVNYDNDGYGFALIRNEIREKYLNDFFAKRELSYAPKITFSDYYPYWPQKDANLSTFPGSIWLDFVLDYESDKLTPRDFGWFYDFYLYWKEVCPTKGFSLRFCYRIDKNSFYQLHCYSTSEFANEDDFYKRFEYVS